MFGRRIVSFRARNLLSVSRSPQISTGLGYLHDIWNDIPLMIRVPPVLRILSFVVLAATTVMLFAGAWTIGATWDEKTHVLMLDTFFKQGWNVSPDALVSGVPDPRYIWGVYVYGPVAELVAHGVAVALGTETLGEPSLTAAAYAGRHIGIALMALIGIAAAGLIVRVITNSWSFALLGAAILSSTPLWIGHGMFNIKDLPVASGMTLAALGIALLFDGRDQKWSGPLGVGTMMAGTVLAAGTRSAIGVTVAACLVAGVGVYFAVSASSRLVPWRTCFTIGVRQLLLGILGLIAAYVALLVIYPKAFINPFLLAWEALVVSARFPFDEQVLTAGMLMDQPPPWTYLPLWFGAQLPVLVVVGVLVFIGFWLSSVFGNVTRRVATLDTRQLAIGAVLLTQMLLMPVAAVMFGSNMYNGSRQFLFVVPAAAVLATIGIWSLTARTSRTLQDSWWPKFIWVGVSIGLVAPVIAQVQLFPYNYVAFNAPTALAPINGNWPTDYWRASGKELMQRLPSEGEESCAYEQGRKGVRHPCSSEPMFSPYLGLRGESARAGSLGENQYWLVRENQGFLDIPRNCQLHDEIVRPLWFQEVVIGQIMVCTN